MKYIVKNYSDRILFTRLCSLPSPHVIEVLVPIEPSCICELGLSSLLLSTILIFDLGIVPTVWYLFSFY